MIRIMRRCLSFVLCFWSAGMVTCIAFFAFPSRAGKGDSAATNAAAAISAAVPDASLLYGRDAASPHLIQTVTPQDIYEGILALGFLENPVLKTEDCEAAYENVKDCIVRISMGNAYGSGILWDMTPEQIVIATNRHVLAFWEDWESLVDFPGGKSVQAKILGVSEEYDVGFLGIENEQFRYEELEQLRYVPKDMEAYSGQQPGNEIFWAGAGTESAMEVTDHFYSGSIGDLWLYLEDFDAYMIYGYGYAKAGMSGGGMFDPKGNLIGMLSGASADGMTAGVPLPVIIEAYTQIFPD